MKSIRFRFLTAALAVSMCAAFVQAQTADSTPPARPMHGHEFGMAHGVIQFYVKALGISEDQQAQMKTALRNERGTMHPLMQQMHQLDEQLKQYVEGNFDAAKVQALVSAQAQTLVSLKVEEAKVHNELYQMLTPDQQAKLKQLQSEREARRQQRMQNASQNEQQD